MFIGFVSTHWLQHLHTHTHPHIHNHKHCSFWHLSCHFLPVSISGLNVTSITANYRTHHDIRLKVIGLLIERNSLLSQQAVPALIFFFKRQHCWSMKPTWWHILEPFEPIRVMYVSAAGGGIVSDAFESFFRVIKKHHKPWLAGVEWLCNPCHTMILLLYTQTQMPR